MAFRDITEILGPIELPIRGKTYTLPTLTIAQGLKLRAVMDPKDETSLDDEEFFTLLLGDAHMEMAADKVGPDVIARAAFVALADWQSGRPAAEAIWETGIDPKVLETYLEKLDSISTSTAEATTTSQPKHGNGTKLPKN
jgi:hypothetical protein